MGILSVQKTAQCFYGRWNQLESRTMETARGACHRMCRCVCIGFTGSGGYGSCQTCWCFVTCPSGLFKWPTVQHQSRVWLLLPSHLKLPQRAGIEPLDSDSEMTLSYAKSSSFLNPEPYLRTKRRQESCLCHNLNISSRMMSSSIWGKKSLWELSLQGQIESNCFRKPTVVCSVLTWGMQDGEWSKHYWWQGMRGEIIQWCQACLVCATRQENRPPMTPTPVLGLFDQVSVGVIQFLESYSGNQYAVVFVDYLTQWLEFIATRDQTALTIAKLLMEHVVSCHGVPA